MGHSPFYGVLVNKIKMKKLAYRSNNHNHLFSDFTFIIDNLHTVQFPVLIRGNVQLCTC